MKWWGKKKITEKYSSLPKKVCNIMAHLFYNDTTVWFFICNKLSFDSWWVFGSWLGWKDTLNLWMFFLFLFFSSLLSVYGTSAPWSVRLLKREKLVWLWIAPGADRLIQGFLKACTDLKTISLSLGGCWMCPCRNSCALKHCFIRISCSWLCCWHTGTTG